MSAEQDSVGDIRQATMPPFNDVMHFARGGGFRATREHASTVSNRDRESLAWTEESLGAPEVENLSERAERESDQPCVADEPINGLAGDGLSIAFEIPVTAVPQEGIHSDNDSHPRSLPTEERSRVGITSESHDVDQGIGQPLVVRAVVAHRVGHVLHLVAERDPTTRRHDRVKSAEEMLTRLRGEQKAP